MENPKWKKKALDIPWMQLKMLLFDFMSTHSNRHDLGYFLPCSAQLALFRMVVYKKFLVVQK